VEIDMSNMSYCRFQNTASDFLDCAVHIRSLDPDDKNQDDERNARTQLIMTAIDLLQEIGIYDLQNTVEINQAIIELDSTPIEECEGGSNSYW
jgi:hypothetical protein